MSKQEIYIRMFELVLPYVRSIQTQSAWVKSRNVSCYFEMELIHNLTKSLLEKDIVDHDIWFLNHQAKSYFENCSDNISPNYSQHVEYIKELFMMVPENLKPKLLWDGP